MPRRTNPVPKYRLHKPTGQAVMTVPHGAGGRRDVYLGKFGSAESRAEYERILGELREQPAAASTVRAAPDGPTVNEFLLAFMSHADEHYRGPAGEVTRELTEYRALARLLRGPYGHTPAKAFGPLALKAVRRTLVDAGLCRGVINRRVGRLKRMFKWAASEEIVPVATADALKTVAGLQHGRGGVREAEPVKPVAAEHVRATMPHVRPEVAAMIVVQELTGMRPGEVCGLRPCEVDTSDPVWAFRPVRHKTAYRGKPRVIAIGPRAQAVLRPFWPADPAAYVFSPKRAVEALHAARSAARKTPLYPSHARRNAAKRAAMPKRPPAERYRVAAYDHAITMGVKRANRSRLLPAGVHGPTLPPVEFWHPNQLRHNYGTATRRDFGLEAAGAGLGHSKLSATEVYAERDATLALKVAAEAG